MKEPAMNRPIKAILLITGLLLLFNGLGNIIDDARVLTYDITSILAGIGFLAVSRQKQAS